VTGSSPVVSVTVDVTNAKTLQLVAGDASDGTAYDHADWAGAGLTALTGPGTIGTLQPISALTPTSSSNGYGPYERNKSNGEQVGGDGRQIGIRGKGYASGLGVHAMSSVTYSLDGNYRTFTSDVGIDDEVNGHGTVTFEVWVDGTRKFRSSVVTGSSPVVSVTVDVTNAKTLQLVAGDASDGTAYDHADWAGAALQTL